MIRPYNDPSSRNPLGGDHVDAIPVQPRQPRNLQGLLRFAMEATKTEDAPGASELGPMDDERRNFLEQAFKSLTVNVAEVLQKAVTVLTDTEKMHSIKLGQDLPEDVATSFTNINEFVCDIDVANDFYKLGGFAIFPVCFGSENASVKAEAASILAEVCQNNPFCQTHVLDCGLLNVLLHLVEFETGVVLVKCLYAISCITRNFEPACRQLIHEGGCTILAQLLCSDDQRVRTKVAFLITHLVRNYPDAKTQFIENNTAKYLAKELDKGLDSSTSCLLNALLELMENPGTSNYCDRFLLKQLKDPELDMKNILEKLWNLPELKEAEYDEERECLNKIKVIFEMYGDAELSDDGDGNDDGADR